MGKVHKLSRQEGDAEGTYCRQVVSKHLSHLEDFQRPRKLFIFSQNLVQGFWIAYMEPYFARGHHDKGIAHLLMGAVFVGKLPSSPIEASEAAGTKGQSFEEWDEDAFVKDHPQGIFGVDGNYPHWKSNLAGNEVIAKDAIPRIGCKEQPWKQNRAQQGFQKKEHFDSGGRTGNVEWRLARACERQGGENDGKQQATGNPKQDG